MEDIRNYEFIVSQKIEGKWKMRRIIAIVGYTLFLVGIFIVCTSVRLLTPLVALSPLFLWLLVYFTWRYTRCDYEISTESNKMRFAIRYGNRTRQPQFEVEFRKMQKIAPYDDEGKAYVTAFSPNQTYVAVSSMQASDIYYAIWEEDQKRYAVLFEATEALLKICRYYNGTATTVTKTTR